MIRRYILLLLCVFCICCSLYAQDKKTQKLNDHLISRAVFCNTNIEKSLRAAPLLLTAPGCKILTLPDKRRMLVAVGVTSTVGKNYVQILNDVGDKPYDELLKWKNGIQMKGVMQYKVKNDDYTMEEIITSISKGHMKSLPKIAHWYSADGTCYFQAIGYTLK